MLETQHETQIYRKLGFIYSVAHGVAWWVLPFIETAWQPKAGKKRKRRKGY